jgi:hypothetical protein
MVDFRESLTYLLFNKHKSCMRKQNNIFQNILLCCNSWLCLSIKHLLRKYANIFVSYRYFEYFFSKFKWAASRQNKHNTFVTSMDNDQPAHLRSLIRISTCYRVCKRTAWILTRLVWIHAGRKPIMLVLSWLGTSSFPIDITPPVNQTGRGHRDKPISDLYQFHA